MKLEDIKNVIPSKIPFGHYYHDEFGAKPVVFSAGIELAIINEEEFYGEVTEAVRRFQAGDYGTAYEEDEKPIRFCEYGTYEGSVGEIHIHRDGIYDVLYGVPYDFVVYFFFER